MFVYLGSAETKKGTYSDIRHWVEHKLKLLFHQAKYLNTKIFKSASQWALLRDVSKPLQAGSSFHVDFMSHPQLCAYIARNFLLWKGSFAICPRAQAAMFLRNSKLLVSGFS